MNEKRYRKALEYSNAMKAWLRGQGEKPVALNLRYANLGSANLTDANLDDTMMNWQSHALIGERLRQAAGSDYSRLPLAGAIANNPDKCWDYWLTHTSPNVREWALSVMRTWVKDADNAPDILKGGNE